MSTNDIEQNNLETQIEYQSQCIFKSIEQNDLISLKSILTKYPFLLECEDEISNTPLLAACNRGCDDIVNYLLASGADHTRINIFGQNALTLATYTNNRNLCEIIMQTTNFDEFNKIGVLSPLCVAALQQNIDLAKLYLSFETPAKHLFDCSSESIHGICPLQLAQLTNNADMIELLQPKHQLHLYKISRIN